MEAESTNFGRLKNIILSLPRYKIIDTSVVVACILVSGILRTVIIRLLNKPMADEQKKLYTLEKDKEKLLKEDASEEEIKKIDEEILEQKKLISMYRGQAGFNPLPLIIGFGVSKLTSYCLKYYFDEVAERRPIAFVLPKGIVPDHSIISDFLSRGIQHPKAGYVSYYTLMRVISPILSKYIISPLLKIPKRPSFFERLSSTFKQMNEGMMNIAQNQ